MTYTQLPQELLLVVAEYLTPAEAVVPSQVCRAWQEVFGSIVWQKYMIKRRDMAPAISTLTKNAHHIRRLEYFATVMDVEDDLAVPYTRLTSLRFFVSSFLSGWKWVRIVPLIVRNQQLQVVVFSDCGQSTQPEVWAALGALPLLRTLELRGFRMWKKLWETVWNGCKGLHELRLFDASIMGVSEFDEEALEIHTELQSITFEESPKFLTLLRRCPNLRRVKWMNDSLLILYDLTGVLLEGKLCQLDSIVLTRAEDQPLASTLSAMSQVKELSVRKGKVEELSCHALTRHFATLQILSIQEHIKNAGAFISTVLASCPLLISVATPVLSAVDIINGRPWVCLQLKVFQIKIEITDTQEDAIRTQSREIFERISKLTYASVDLTEETHLPSRGWTCV
ncbi:hypothetical protein BGZ93_010863 [Podila epicladia]|nr:hypothetical protein BGZ93_010863 [Podila epicladia]